MRWRTKKTPKPGDVRHNWGFLLLPMSLDGETRWLENADWTEALREVVNGDGELDYHWEALYWGSPDAHEDTQDWGDCGVCGH